MNQGALYPVLRSMEKQGLLQSETRPSTNGPPRRYYEITPIGKKTLKEWKLTWRRTTLFVNSILGESNAQPPKDRSRSTGASVPKRT